MMNLQKLRSVREGQRRIITRQLEKFEGELSQVEKLELLEIITEKADIIRGLNDKIVNHQDTDDIESELYDSEEYSIELNLKLRKLRESVNTRAKQTTEETVTTGDESQDHRETSNNASVSSAAQGGRSNLSTGNSNGVPHERLQDSSSLVRSDIGQSVSSHLNPSLALSYYKLPKLRLPEFDGDITQWQTFWDSYESSVHIG